MPFHIDLQQSPIAAIAAIVIAIAISAIVAARSPSARKPRRRDR